MVMRQNQLFHYLWKQNWGARKPNSTSRIMRPDDANIVGNVHGGTILKMIEEAGCIIGTRHCNTQTGDRCVAALARVERTDFLYPMFIGEVAHVSAEITYTSKHSVEVQINVLSENIVTGTKKVTNKATLWYVPLSLQNVDKIIEVPPIEYSSSEQEEAGKKRYEAQKLERLETKERNGEILMSVSLPDRQTKEPYTVAFSQSSLIHLIGPSDCTMHGFVHGGILSLLISSYILLDWLLNLPSRGHSTQHSVYSGVTMKLMDEVAGIVAARHCKTNIVTASVDAINFHRKIKKGCVITVSGRMTFTSNKSMEIEVFVDAESLVEAEKGKYRAVTAFFTYISLDKDNKPLPVPPLKLEGEEEQKRFEEGKARYLQNKAKRLTDKERQQ
ncbi:cytosolic acyl coenzyme A thioester hydrolase isoform X1 [Megalobrama amblycephala]|uniref:cytosolic acyl coenzyme A thioester hydrolase isoform X1 n=1 Tax=Megalobrama amblycephala TaxID=75352 RepID=UPI002013F9FD|nr:cytosolic acyl coenzyme A thioester hydrolase isoform X1 [Megalobrama amblycephala]